MEKISLFPIFSLVSGSGSLISTASPISPGPTGFCGGRITFRGSGSFFSSSGFSASSLALSSFYTQEFTELFKKNKLLEYHLSSKIKYLGFLGFLVFLVSQVLLVSLVLQVSLVLLVLLVSLVSLFLLVLLVLLVSLQVLFFLPC